MPRDIRPGDRVAYSAKFLRSIGCQTGPVPFLRGTVSDVRRVGGRSGVTVATVAWNSPDEGDTVNVANLIRVEDMPLECVL